MQQFMIIINHAAMDNDQKTDISKWQTELPQSEHISQQQAGEADKMINMIE